jgi:hypothetical protein
LSLKDFPSRVSDSEPSRVVDFRKGPTASGVRRLFHFEGIAADERAIPVAFNGPSLHDLAACLPCLAERKEFSVRIVSGLFDEFARASGSTGAAPEGYRDRHPRAGAAIRRLHVAPTDGSSYQPPFPRLVGSRRLRVASLRTADPRRNVCLLGKIGSERYRVEVTRMTQRGQLTVRASASSLPVCTIRAVATPGNFLAQTTLIVTPTLPRVALEYGQIVSASSTRSFAALRSKPGSLTLSRVLRK